MCDVDYVFITLSYSCHCPEYLTDPDKNPFGRICFSYKNYDPSLVFPRPISSHLEITQKEQFVSICPRGLISGLNSNFGTQLPWPKWRRSQIQGLNCFSPTFFPLKSLSEHFPMWDKVLNLMEASLCGVRQVCEKETIYVNFILCLKTMKHSGSVLIHRALTKYCTSESSWQKPSRAGVGGSSE